MDIDRSPLAGIEPNILNETMFLGNVAIVRVRQTSSSRHFERGFSAEEKPRRDGKNRRDRNDGENDR